MQAGGISARVFTNFPDLSALGQSRICDFRNRPRRVRVPAEEQLGVLGAEVGAQRQARHQEVRTPRRHGVRRDAFTYDVHTYMGSQIVQ